MSRLKNTQQVLKDYIIHVLEDNGWEDNTGSKLVLNKNERTIEFVADYEGGRIVLWDGGEEIARLQLTTCLENPLFHYFIK